VAKRRRWTILFALILVPAAAVGVALRQTPQFQATSYVLISEQNPASSLTNATNPTQGVFLDADRVAQTQVQIARVSNVAARALAGVGLTDRTPEALLAASSVTARPNADLLQFSVTDPSRTLAVELANEYARQFTRYRAELDTAALKRAETEVQTHLHDLSRSGDSHSALYQSLRSKSEQLQTLAALQTSNASVLRLADNAAQVAPRPVRDGVLGLALGALLAFGLAFLREALDTRVRSGEEIRTRLNLPLLARIPAPPKELAAADRLVMMEAPTTSNGEAFRLLRTNLEFTNLDVGARCIMVSSAVAGEGKSTTIGNLAVALARAGKNVILVDLDLRRPYVHKFFDLNPDVGITSVALGAATIDEALVSIPLGTPEKGHGRYHAMAAGGNVLNGGGVNGDSFEPPAGAAGGSGGSLRVMTCGPLPPDPGEFVGKEALGQVLERLRGEADLILVDSPPLLQVGDALALSPRVDALLLMTRIKVIRRPMLLELEQALAASQVHKLGFVLSGAEEEEGYGYGGYYYYYGKRGYYYEAAKTESVA
jgi:Mrp family chromosome partitioning ATPase/capsular polysaccharide biosynthesis protein